MDNKEKALEMHRKWNGKLETVSKTPVKTREDLAIAYTPGVAEPCKVIAEDPSAAYTYTMKANTVAVVSDGSAVLGLGNIGPYAAMPVMEGKCVLFKEFGDVNAVPICLDTQDTEEIITAVKNIAPAFGGINLEDISAPRCFEIETRLNEMLDIPVFHDDQHGTAIVVLAGIINALKVVGKKKEDCRVVVNGAGSAGVAITRLLLTYGFSNIIMCDKSGILCVLGFLPGTALAVFGMMAGSALLTVVGGVVGGLVGGPFLSGMIDTVLRALRDEPGYWWNTYKRAWKQNWRQSLVPGALLGLFVGSWAWMLRAQAESGNTSTALWVASIAGIFVCTGFFTWLLAQVPLVDLPLAQIAKNAGLMFFGFFPRTAAAALVLALYWGATLLYLPATILTILAFGFWLPVTIALMIVYPGLEKVFKLEETINARRAAEIEERMAQNQPKFDQ